MPMTRKSAGIITLIATKGIASLGGSDRVVTSLRTTELHPGHCFREYRGLSQELHTTHSKGNHQASVSRQAARRTFGTKDMTESIERRIVASIEELLCSYAEDARAVGILNAIQRDLHAALQDIPQSLKCDLHSVLRLLIDSKSDNAQLWGQVVQLKEDLAATHAQLTKLQSSVLFTFRRHIQNTASEVMQQALRKARGAAEQVVGGQGRYQLFYKQDRARFQADMCQVMQALGLNAKAVAQLGARVIKRRNNAVHELSHADLDEAQWYLNNYPELATELKDEKLVIFAAMESRDWWENQVVNEELSFDEGD